MRIHDIKKIILCVVYFILLIIMFSDLFLFYFTLCHGHLSIMTDRQR